MLKVRIIFSGLWVILLVILSACSPIPSQQKTGTGSPEAPGFIRVVATTTILGDVVRQVGGGFIELTILLPAGIDPHSFEPAPQDIAAVAHADLIIVNGVGLEVFLDRLLKNAGSTSIIVTASDGIALRQLGNVAGEAGATGPTNVSDPHVWFNPNNVIIWTQNIERALSDIDPAHAPTYSANALAYQAQLLTLDSWITEQVSQIPQENRNLVTDHEDMGYYADRYGLKQTGTVIPGFSSVSQPSAQELAALEEIIRINNIRALFIGTTVNPNLAQRVASDTGAQLVMVYTDALTQPGGKADSYLTLMRFDTSAIVEALK